MSSRWRAPVTGALAGLATAAAVVGPTALASGGDSSTPCASPPALKAPAPDRGPGDGPFLAAVAQMQQAGTITAAQARVLDTDLRIGRIDTDRLVNDGTFSAAKMHTVIDRLGAIKRSLAPSNKGGRGAGG